MPDLRNVVDVDLTRPEESAWQREAIARVQADARRSADTHLLRLPLGRAFADIDVYLKDESTHLTGSLKHRLARSLMLHALCSGLIREGKPVIEASSGSTAVSEAYFARLIGVPFIAVMPRSTSCEKVRLIERAGGRCHFVDHATQMHDTATRLALESGGHFMDQFANAERATDWRGNNNIAESMFDQLALERFAVPEWIVVGAGTGGTSATIGRFLRYRQLPTRLCVVDPENSAFFEAWRGECGAAEASSSPDGAAVEAAVEHDDAAAACARPGSRIEGIGRPRAERSFLPRVVDRMMQVPDAASFAAARLLRERFGFEAGPSTGTNLVGVLWLAARMRAKGRSGSIVTLLCDGASRYADTVHSDAWAAASPLPVSAWQTRLGATIDTGTWHGDDEDATAAAPQLGDTSQNLA